MQIVSAQLDVSEALVEKDYWITHTLWSLQESGLTVHFKGGSSLSKGYNLIERFSEDLDVKIVSERLPDVTSWTAKSPRALHSRRDYFESLEEAIRVPGAVISRMEEHQDPSLRNVVFKVEYPGGSRGDLPEGMADFVQIEVGSARMIPGEERELSSWVHDYLHQRNPELAANYVDNRPRVHCVSPFVTLLEKLEAISRSFSRTEKSASAFVRHYEDAYHILARFEPTDESLVALLGEMEADKDIRRWPTQRTRPSHTMPRTRDG